RIHLRMAENLWFVVQDAMVCSRSLAWLGVTDAMAAHDICGTSPGRGCVDVVPNKRQATQSTDRPHLGRSLRGPGIFPADDCLAVRVRKLVGRTCSSGCPSLANTLPLGD